MNSKLNIATAGLGTVVAVMAFALVATKTFSETAQSQVWSDNSLEEETASVERGLEGRKKLEREWFYKKYVCDHACRYTLY